MERAEQLVIHFMAIIQKKETHKEMLHSIRGKQTFEMK